LKETPMHTKTLRLAAIIIIAIVALIGPRPGLAQAAGADEALSLGVVEAVSIAVDAYIYGYPLVTFNTVRKQQTNVATPDAEHAPMGQMIKMRSYPAVDNHCCAALTGDPAVYYRLRSSRVYLGIAG
jgi:hypothetical protein